MFQLRFQPAGDMDTVDRTPSMSSSCLTSPCFDNGDTVVTSRGRVVLGGVSMKESNCMRERSDSVRIDQAMRRQSSAFPSVMYTTAMRRSLLGAWIPLVDALTATSTLSAP